MESVSTPSFTLAVNVAGDVDAARVALVLPGRLDTKDYAHMRAHVAHLARRGFYAVSFDPPGTWESSGDCSLFTTTNYLKAVNELVDQLGRPALLVGHSRGGAIAALAADNPAVIGLAAAMATYGPASAPSSEALQLGYQPTSRDLPSGGAADDAGGPRREFRLPLSYFSDSQGYDAAAALLGLDKPKLLVYGDSDEFTPWEAVEDLYRQLPEPKLIRRLDAEHDYRFDARLIAAVNDALDALLELVG